MKKLALLFLAIPWSMLGMTYTITEHPYRLSTYYEMQGEKGYVGRVIRSSLSARTCYDLYDAEGMYEAEGICRLLSLGVFCTWAREIDVYDASGDKIGFIDGRLWTTANAKYTIYNKDEKAVAIACVDYDAAGITIMDTSSMERPLAYLKRNKIQEDWNVMSYADVVLDPRLLKIFSAFAVHYQDSFGNK